MKITKKDGSVEEFIINKTITSIDNSARDLGDPLNESDLKIISRDIVEVLECTRGADGVTSSYEVIGTVVDVLKREGFNSILKSYIGFKK